jgi:hypothetical protein
MDIPERALALLPRQRCEVHAPVEVETWPARITVPYPPESVASGIGDRGFHYVCWYERDFEVQCGNQRVILHFGAVDYAAEVWVNGSLAASHEGGHTPFSADITELLHASGKQTVSVRVEDDPLDLAKPRGKQDWQAKPHAIWYPRTTGIWQTVWLEVVSRTFIESIRWTPNVENFALRFEAFLGRRRGQRSLGSTSPSSHGQRLLAHDRYRVVDREIDRQIALSDPGIDDFRNELLWSPERPTLLQAKVRLYKGDS